MAFRVGMKVVCIHKWKDTNCPHTLLWPQKGEVYTIREIRIGADGDSYFHLNEIVNPIRPFNMETGEAFFWSRRFRPVVSTNTGMAILEQIRRDVTNKELRPICHDEQV